MPWVTGTIHNILNEVLRNTAASPAFPTTAPLLALFTTPPTIDGTGFVEVTTGQLTGYARQPVTFSSPVSRSTSNSNLLTFATSATLGGASFTVTHGGIFMPAPNTTVMLAYGLLATALVVNNGSLVQIPVTSFTITDTVVT